MTVKGLDSLRRKLAALPDLAREEIAKAMEAGAQEIVDLARSLVPIDDMTLYESINWTWGKAPRGALTLASSRNRAGRNSLLITVYAGNDQAFYARWVEFGTSPHNVASGGGTVKGRSSNTATSYLGHPGAAAQPFFYVSYRANRRRVRARITRGINNAAKKQASGTSRG